MQDLKGQLEKAYELICFEDIGQHVFQHKDFFNLLKSLKRDRFLFNQRLVFYTSHDPDQVVLKHIQRAASKVDIPNYFILICCPYDITLKLAQANQLFGFDELAISSQLVNIPDSTTLTPNGIYPADSLCPAIFAQLDIGPGGFASPCCVFKGAGILGNINTSTIGKLLGNQILTDVRNDIKNAQYHDSCSVCFQLEAEKLDSNRQHLLEKFSDADFYLYDDIRLRSLLISPATRCNFHCRSCTENSSSKIAQEKLKFEGPSTELQTNINNFSWSYNINLPENIAKHSDFLEFLHILGGEPSIIKELPGFLDKLTELIDTKNIQLEFNTNASNYQFDINTLATKFNIDTTKFKSIELLLSIDDIGQRFEIQRGGKWSQVSNNIKKYAKLNNKNNIIVKIGLTVSIQNVLYLEQLMEFANSLNLDIVWTYVDSPSFLSINFMTEAAKQLVYNQYHDNENINLKNIASRVINGRGSDGIEFVEYQRKLDLRRNENFGSVHPEIWEAMGGTLPNV
jgi:hypothetical protein